MQEAAGPCAPVSPCSFSLCLPLSNISSKNVSHTHTHYVPVCVSFLSCTERRADEGAAAQVECRADPLACCPTQRMDAALPDAGQRSGSARLLFLHYSIQRLTLRKPVLLPFIGFAFSSGHGMSLSTVCMH